MKAEVGQVLRWLSRNLRRRPSLLSHTHHLVTRQPRQQEVGGDKLRYDPGRDSIAPLLTLISNPSQTNTSLLTQCQHRLHTINPPPSLSLLPDSLVHWAGVHREPTSWLLWASEARCRLYRHLMSLSSREVGEDYSLLTVENLHTVSIYSSPPQSFRTAHIEFLFSISMWF